MTSPDGYTRRYHVSPAERRPAELLHDVSLTTGCRLTVMESPSLGFRFLTIQEPSDDGTFTSGFVAIPRRVVGHH